MNKLLRIAYKIFSAIPPRYTTQYRIKVKIVEQLVLNESEAKLEGEQFEI